MNKAMKLGELESRVCDSSFNLGTAGRNGVFVSVSLVDKRGFFRPCIGLGRRKLLHQPISALTTFVYLCKEQSTLTTHLNVLAVVVVVVNIFAKEDFL